MASSSDAKSASSPATSAPSSLRSVDLSPRVAPVAGQNGAPPENTAIDAAPKQADKTSVKGRLTRMFSSKDGGQRPADGGVSQHFPQDQQQLPTRTKDANNLTPQTSARAQPPTPQRQTSSGLQPEKSNPQANSKPSDKTNGKDSQWQRFVADPNLQGGHEHHLKSSRRQEKLSDMFKGFLGKKVEKAPDHDLSLVSGWVDSLKREKDTMQSEVKPVANPSATLVEKYGKCQEVVGRGAFGIVRISHKKQEGGERLFAVKEFRRRPGEEEKKYSKRLTAEFCISSALRHPNVIHTLDLLKDAKGDFCEVMEFCAGGDLYTLVLAAGKLEVTEADCFFKQMMRGVEYMHEMGVAHRDLKPENLLLTTTGGLKITDFGNGECFRMAWENDAHMVSGLCGSAPYIAPEEYVDKEFDARAVDVWACGVIYMAMRTGRHLWRVAKKDQDEFYARYLEGRRDEEGYGPIESLHRVSACPYSEHQKGGRDADICQARCRNVIYSILDPNPTRRITASQVLKSEWGREIKLCKAGEEGL
jgi:protein-serine/threonine kinase